MSSAAGRDESTPWRARASAVALASGLIGYAAATHWAVASGYSAALAPALAVAPLVAGLVWFGVRTHRSAWVKGVAIATALGLAVLATRRATPALGLLYPLPSVLVYAGLLWMFARTLAPGREALITGLARQVRGTLPDELTAYTRQVTWAWCVFFAAMTLTSLLLFVFAPLRTWSLFVNVLGLPLIAAMFVAEYVYRVVRYRRFSHASLLTSVGAFHKFGRGAASRGRSS
jgi:uncharacterized membrane protein